MRFLADENLPRLTVVALRAAGADVLWVTTAAPGAQDDDVLALAEREQRIVLTFDKDFGEVAARSRLSADYGIVLLRVPAPKSAEAAQRLAELITARNDWSGNFSVIEPGRIRMRPLPLRN